ncbi:protein PIN-LIKES 7-like isoform X2 [Henckelia pumila]|uniref:protein PIN-LIKES 7-like isoform X2 n=1 Tax=Henckelia pumila TaxID=405737 RepID=UPI003C6E5E71
MGFWSLLKVASMPVVQVLLISTLGAFMATDYLKLLSNDARKSLNKIVFFIFTPSLVFTSLAQTVRFQDIITWWFMPVNIGITFLVGGSIGWIAVKLIKPEPHIQNLVIAMSSAGNLGNILLIIIPAICKEDGNPFGDKSVCSKVGLSYVSFSMALGAFFIWTHSYHLIRSAGVKYRTTQLVTDDIESSKEPNEDLEDNNKNSLLVNGSHRTNNSMIESMDNPTLWNQILGICHKLGEELLSPPVIAAVIGFTFGTITWLRDLIIGDLAPLRVIQDSIKLLGMEKGEIEANPYNCGDLCEIHNTSHSWDRSRESGFTFRISSLRSSVPLRANDTVHSSTGHEHRYDDTTIRCSASRVFGPFSLDILGGGSCCHRLVHYFHVVTVLNHSL